MSSKLCIEEYVERERVSADDDDNDNDGAFLAWVIRNDDSSEKKKVIKGLMTIELNLL